MATRIRDQIFVNYRVFPDQPIHGLALHAGFRCSNCGQCCREGWHIRLTAEEADSIRRAIAESDLHGADTDGPFTLPVSGPDGKPTECMALDPEGVCRLQAFDEGASICRLQRYCGHEVLSSICQCYPRVALATPGGVFVTLSNACPTAAQALLNPEGVDQIDLRRHPVNELMPRMIGHSITGDVTPPTFGSRHTPTWEAFHYFWRWAAQWSGDHALAPSQALFGLGLIVGKIEQIASQILEAPLLIDALDSMSEGFAGRLAHQRVHREPCTELGAVYADVLSGLFRCADPDLPDPFTEWRTPDGHLDRSTLVRLYDQHLRPTLDEFECIERNFVVARLLVNPLIAQATQLRTGYFLNVIGLIGLRFFALLRAETEARRLDETHWLWAAGQVDRLLMHRGATKTRLLDLLDASVRTDIRNLAQPALF